MVTHHIQFAAMYSDTGNVFLMVNMFTSISEKTNKFLKNNNFYTTFGNKMSRHLFDHAITCEDAVKLCKMNLDKEEKTNKYINNFNSTPVTILFGSIALRR